MEENVEKSRQKNDCKCKQLWSIREELARNDSSLGNKGISPVFRVIQGWEGRPRMWNSSFGEPAPWGGFFVEKREEHALACERNLPSCRRPTPGRDFCQGWREKLDATLSSAEMSSSERIQSYKNVNVLRVTNLPVDYCIGRVGREVQRRDIVWPDSFVSCARYRQIQALLYC